MRNQRKAAPGRPHKYGRPARLVSLTLPDDVLQWLSGIHPDPAWAIVTLCERATRKGAAQPQAAPAAELVQLPKCGGLIIVKPDTLHDIEGVSTIPLADGRALIALTNGRGIADLELALLEKMDDERLPAARRREMERLRQMLREWRTSVDLTFSSPSIIVARRSSRRGTAATDPEQPDGKQPSGRRTRRPFLALSWWMPAANLATHAFADTTAQVLAFV